MRGRVHTSSISVDLIAGVARDEAQRLQARLTAAASARRARPAIAKRSWSRGSPEAIVDRLTFFLLLASIRLMNTAASLLFCLTCH
jgi:hypothetical protein